MRLDVTSDGDAAGLAEAVRVHSDRVDALINNAAIHYDIGQRAADADLGLVGEALETNMIGAWRATLALLDLGATQRAPPHRERLQRCRLAARHE